jgi:two-component system, sensor histidine kinase and response regulator
MTPQHFKVIFWTLAMLPVICHAQTFPQNDSLEILQLDSIALRVYLSKPDSSIRTATRALETALAIRSPYLEGFSYYILSKAYWAKANYKLSTEFGFKALKKFENTAEVTLWTHSLLSLARTFIDLKNLQQGRVYIERAIALSKRNRSDRLLAESYREKSMLFSEMLVYDSALYYSDEGLKLFEKLQDSVSMSILFSRKGKIYISQGNYEESSYYNKKGLMYDSLIGNRRALGISYYQSAQDAVYLKDLNAAILLLQKSIPINEEMHNLTTLIRVHNLLADIYMQQKKPELAVKELQRVNAYKDSLYNVEKGGQIQEMQSIYELASKEKTIAMLEKDNEFRQQQMNIQKLFVGGLLVCVILLGLMIFYLQRYRGLEEKTNIELANKNAAIEQQKEEIQSQAETLQQLNQLKIKLFSVISHDLRGPMATLHALLDLLTHKRLSQDEFISISEKLKTSMGVTQRTLENLLNWSMSQMEGLKTKPKTVDIHYTIEEACDLMGEAAWKKNISIEKKLDGPLLVKADSDQLQLILRNLIHNAIKFSKPYENISVSASRESDFCVVSVEDSGIGMTKAELETVASSKHHFSKTGTMQEKGTGLGLLLCQEFIKLNGGEIAIRSSINQGTVVSFTLPLA